MKLNIGLFFILCTLLSVSYYFFENKSLKDGIQTRKDEYLINWELSEKWCLELDKGNLCREGHLFKWNEKVIDSHDKNLAKTLNQIGDFKIIGEASEGAWGNEPKVATFRFGEQFELGPYNKLTGRFLLRSTEQGRVYIIEDESIFSELYESFEQVQQIKYNNFKYLINHLEF